MARLAYSTEYDPSATDPRVLAVLEARSRLNDAGARHDVEAFEALFATDIVVNSPINAVVHRDNILARFRNSHISYDSADEKIEFIGVRGDFVVVMGEEIVTPIAHTPNAGKIVHRRFTDIWREIDGAWKLAARQATTVSTE